MPPAFLSDSALVSIYNPATSHKWRSLAGGRGMFIGVPADLMRSYWSVQEREDYCWSACVQMVLRVYGVERPQSEIDLRGNWINLFGLFPDRSGTRFSIENNFNEFLFSQFISTHGEGAPAPNRLLDEFSNCRPIIVGYYENPLPHHAIVIFGADCIQTNGGTVIKTISVADPFPGREIVFWDSEQLYRTISSHWCIHAYN